MYICAKNIYAYIAFIPAYELKALSWVYFQKYLVTVAMEMKW